MTQYTVKPLAPDTWDAFARLVERHNGVWGGCWCTWFHAPHAEQLHSAEGNCELKRRLVGEGRAHAALVFDGEAAVGWCQYGPPGELPNIYHRKEYQVGLLQLPDYRLIRIPINSLHSEGGATSERGCGHGPGLADVLEQRIVQRGCYGDRPR